MNQIMYTEEVLRRFRNPKHAGELANAYVGEVGNAACGDIIRVFVKLENSTIKDCKFLTYGCCAAIAAADALCDLAIGKTLAEVEKITWNDIITLLGGVPKIKEHCSMLGIRALKKAIAQCKEKK